MKAWPFLNQTFGFLLISSIISSVKCLENPLVTIDSEDFKGSIVGVEKQNILNSTFAAFLGIPYAKAPTGSLRFRDPQRLDKFEGTYYANHLGYECCSITATNASEDCLKLNVYTKQLNPSKPLPVVVLIHPGGLYLGNAQWMDPSYMMTKDMVLVSFNYRLGTLGFLNLGTKDVPGNAGFKDQVYALRWIQRNIGHFGGNPQDVTLMGYSAGALSITLHLVSDMTQGLFHKAIIMSGSMPPQIKLPQGHQRYLAVRQAKRLGCEEFKAAGESHEDFSDADMLSCLNRFKGMELANTLRQMFDFGKDNPIYLWLPIIEKDYGQERFLQEDFYTQLKERTSFTIPLLMGYANGEFCTSAGNILEDPVLKDRLEKEFGTLAPRIFLYDSQGDKQSINRNLQDYYFNGSKIFTNQDYDALCDVFSNSLIRFGAHHIAEMVNDKGGVVYFYEFVYQHKAQRGDEQFPNKKDRVEHMDDFQYLFNWSQTSDVSEEYLKMVDLYTTFMYDFIKNGKLSQPDAKPYPSSYASIDSDVQFVKGRSFQNYQFWLDLFKHENGTSNS